MAEKHIPRWQQGFRPGPAYEDTWLKMSPRERRWSFMFDMRVVALVVLGMIVATALGHMTPKQLWGMIVFIAIFLGILFAGNRGPIDR